MNSILTDKRVPVWLLALASVIMVPVLAFYQRGTLLSVDAMATVVHRDAWSLNDMLLAHNGQFMPITWFVFNLDASLFYPGAPAIFVVLSIGAQLALAWGIFEFSRRRVDPWIAASFALLILTYGAGHEVIAWSFNFSWVISLAAGTWALNVNDGAEDTTRNRVLTAALLLLSLMGNNIGVVFCVAIGSQVFFKGSRSRALWIVAPLLSLWVLWYLNYAVGTGVDSGFAPKAWPYMIVKQIEGSFNGYIFDMIAWGPPLTVLGVGLIVWRLWKLERITPSLLTAVALPLTFTAMIAVTRSNSDPGISRYKYTLAVFFVFVFAEVLRGTRIKRLGPLLTCGVLVLFLAAGNTIWMATGANVWRSNAQVNREYFNALSIVGRDVACSTQFDPPDPLMIPLHNCILYDSLVARGGHQFSESELAERPGADARVQKWAGEMRVTAK